MLPLSIRFEFTDSVAARASTENTLALGRKLFTPAVLVLMVVVTAGFVYGIRDDEPWHWIWLVLTGSGPFVFALMLIGWLGLFWWAPRAAKKKAAHLPHRQIVIELTDPQLVLQSATERLAVDWIELKEVRALPNFWVISLRSGGEIPVPRDAVPPDALEVLRSRATKKTP